MTSELLTPAQLAEALGMSVQSLAQWRYLGKGPLFIKIGKHVRYRASDVDAWLTEQTRQQAGEVCA